VPVHSSSVPFSSAAVVGNGLPSESIHQSIVQHFNVHFFYILLLFTFADAQTFSMTGRVIDGSTLSGIAFATVSIPGSAQSGQSDDEGYFHITIPPSGTVHLAVRHPAYRLQEMNIDGSASSGDTVIVRLTQRIFQSDEVLIQSTRLSAAERNTPFPVTAHLQDELVRRPEPTVSDLLKHSPGISLVQDGTWQTSVAIRGMNRSSIVALVDHARIETASDISGAFSLINVHDLERIETVRSSGAALYGTGALGGIVHFLTKRAPFTEFSDIRGEVSSDLASVNNCFSQYIALEGTSERLAGRISGGHRRADNMTTPSGILPNSQFRDLSITGSLGLKTFGEQSLHLSYQLSQAEDTGISGGSPISSTASATYKRMRRELFRAEYTVPELTAAVISTTARLSLQNIRRNVEIIQSPTLTLTPHAIHSTVNAQFESRITAGPGHYLVLGADLWQRDLVSKRERINTAARTVTGENPVPHSQFLSGGIYGQYEWSVIPDVISFIGGVRYDLIRITNDDAVNPEYIITNGSVNRTPPNQTLLWRNGRTVNSSWSVNGGLQYSLFGNTELTMLASTAFRSPSLEERFQYLALGDGIHLGNPDLEPEHSTGLNTGLRWHDDGTNIRADVFVNSLADLVADVPGTFEGNPAFIKQNISRARLYGYELSGERQLGPGTVVLFSVSSVRGEDTEMRTNLPFIPPVHGSLEIRTSFDGLGTLALSSAFSAAQSFTASGEIRTPGYAVTDIDALSEQMNSGHFSLTVRFGIRNVFNKAYRNHLSTIRGTNREAPGRNFTVSITVTV
jgi:hemoglobin/transferrin/lactoferrin receptor protein